MKVRRILVFSCIAIILTAIAQAEQPKIDINRLNWGQALPLGANITFNNGYIHNLKNGTAPQDAVTLSQLNAKSGGANYYVTVGPYSWCDFITDGTQDEVQINQAIDSLVKTGGTIVLTNGYFYIDNPISISKCNITLQGGNTTLKSVSTTKDIIKIEGTSSEPCGYINFHGLNFGTTVTKTAGWCINGTYAYNITLDNIRAPKQIVGTGIYGGFKFVHFRDIVINNIFVVHTYKGIVLSDGKKFSLSHSTIMCIPPPAYDTFGVEFAGACMNMRIVDTNLLSNDVGVKISKSVTNTIDTHIFIEQCYIDSSRRWGVFIDEGAMVDGYLLCNDCWITSSGVYETNPVYYGACGIHISPSNSNCQFTFDDCKIFNGRGSGVVINSGYGVISGCQITHNGLGNTNGGDGITNPVGAGKWVITGNLIAFNGNSARGYGVSLVGATYCAVVGNVFWGNGQGQITGAGAGCQVASNALT